MSLPSTQPPIYCLLGSSLRIEDEKKEELALFKERLDKISLFSELYGEISLVALPLNRLILEILDVEKRLYFGYSFLSHLISKSKENSFLDFLISCVVNKELQDVLYVFLKGKPTSEFENARHWISLSDEQLQRVKDGVESDQILVKKSILLANWFSNLPTTDFNFLIKNFIENCIDPSDRDLLVELVIKK
jgi:hypothetical protein